MAIVHWPTFAIAATSLGSGVIGSVYSFYYIKVFLEFYQIQPAYLNFAQIVFMVWNAVNDPLFGCMQDVGCGRWAKWLMNRRKVILYMGPFFSASFLLFWFPWTKENPPWLVGMHLLTALFIYDSMLSLVLSAYCGLFTELSTDHSDRVRVVIYMEIAGFIGSLAIFPIDKLSRNLEDFAVFQYICIGLAIFSALCFLYTGYFAPRAVAQVKHRIEMTSTCNAEIEDKKSVQSQTLRKSLVLGLKSSWQIMRERDFLCVVIANLFHIMRMTAASNFTAIFMEAMVSPSGLLPKGSTELSVFYQMTQTLPSLTFFLLWPLLNKLGPWLVNNGLLFISFINFLLIFLVGRHNYMWLAAYLLAENILCRAGYFAVYNIFLPDVVDEDMTRHNRKSPMSTLVFTLNALITKPAHSFSPMIVVFFLSQANYAEFNKMNRAQKEMAKFGNSIFASNNTTNTHFESTMVPQQFDNLYDVMFTVAYVFPLICAVAEVLVLAPYRLKFRHRRQKTAIQAVESEIKCQ